MNGRLPRRSGTRHGLNGAEIMHELRRSATPGRCYFVDDCGHLVKVVSGDLDMTMHLRVNDLRQEAVILQAADGISGIPSVEFLECNDDWHALGTRYVEGVTLADTTPELTTIARVVWHATRKVVRLSLRGISHNDIKEENIILAADGTVWLIDFDQATTGHTRWRAFVRNMVGSRFYPEEVVVHASIRTLVRSLMKRRALAVQRRLPPPTTAVTPQQRRLYEAWRIAQRSDANAPGDGVAYYALEIDGLKLPGERPWNSRWDVLRGVIDFSGKRVLELGCNMGLLSVYAHRFAGASDVWGVDHDGEILQSARLVADAFEAPVRFSAVDLSCDEGRVAELAAFDADVVTCLNVWNWVPDRRLLSQLLAAAPEVVFEGHESPEVEIARLKSLGFDEVDLVTSTERGRPLLHARKVSTPVHA